MDKRIRRELATLLCELDQICTKGDDLLAEPTITPEDDAKANVIVVLLKAMRQNVERHLARQAESDK
jgi:hypothetical protein